MSSIKRPLISIIIRSVSTCNSKEASTLSIDCKESYYQKIAKRASKNNDDVKPEGWFDAKPFNEVPGPKPLPLIGNLWRFLPGGDFHRLQLVDMHRRFQKQYGNLTYLSGIPGQLPMVFSYNPDDFEKTLRSAGPWPIRNGFPSFVYYRNHVRDDVFQGVGGVLTVHGEEWFNARSIINKILMNTRTVEMYVNSMDNITNGLIANIRKFSNSNPKQEMPEDFQNELYKWTLESIGVIAYNRRMGCLDSNMASEGQELINASLEFFELLYELDVLPSLWPIISTKKWRRYVQILDFFTEKNQQFIKECLAQSDPNPDIPDYERSVLERLTRVDFRVAVAMVTDLTIAGVDTTGKTMAAALYYLAKNPEKQEKLRSELKTYLPSKDSPVTKDMLRQSPYLKAVIKETTRVAPVAIGNLRRTIKDMVLSGYQIPKGTEVMSINIIPSLDENHFIKAKEFIPERWLRTTQDELSYKNVHPFVFMPFGFGPRSCVGKRLANLELEVGLSKVIRNFKMSWNYPDAAFGSKLLYGIIDPLKIKMEEVAD